MNAYSYVLNRPTVATDPEGRAVFLETHPVTPLHNHSKITIVPDCQTNWLSDPRFVNRTPGGIAYATIGAGPEGGRLVSNVNRPTDVDRTHNNYASMVSRPANVGDDAFIHLLFDTDARYQDNLDYEIFPQTWTDGYNSNSFACGLLTVTTGVVPVQPPSTPGFNKPVPARYFQ